MLTHKQNESCEKKLRIGENKQIIKPETAHTRARNRLHTRKQYQT